MTNTDLLQEEYQTLRAEVASCMEELSSIERYCIYAVAAGFAWLSTKPMPNVVAGAWLIPPVIVLFGMFRSWTIGIQLAWLSQYLGSIEERVYCTSDKPLGWEHFLAEEVERKNPITGSKRMQPRRGIRAKTTYYLWSIMLLLTITFSILGFSANSNNVLNKWLTLIF
jgi:hypothetical protein